MALPTTITVINDGPATRTVAGVAFPTGESEHELELIRFMRQMGWLDESQQLRFRYELTIE